MGLTVTTGNYCFVRCDGPRCAKKIEHNNAKALLRLLKLCEWESREDLWFCKNCARHLDQKPA
jgi:hypothetical protein